jgi:hypothetical protein
MPRVTTALQTKCNAKKRDPRRVPLYLLERFYVQSGLP